MNGNTISPLCLSRTGASKVIIFNHIVRNAPQDIAKYAINYKGPTSRPHVDVTPKYAPKMLKTIMPLMRSEAEYDSIMTGRWQVVNLWRPLATIKRDPLCVADYISVPQADLASYEYDRGEQKDVENYWVDSGLKEGQKDEELRHKWYYLHEQTPDEVMLFKIYDSDEVAKTKGVAHSAVVVEGTEELPPRQSIEMRAFVCD
jgi:hypothetical protein